MLSFFVHLRVGASCHMPSSELFDESIFSKPFCERPKAPLNCVALHRAACVHTTTSTSSAPNSIAVLILLVRVQRTSKHAIGRFKMVNYRVITDGAVFVDFGRPSC